MCDLWIKPKKKCFALFYFPLSYSPTRSFATKINCFPNYTPTNALAESQYQHAMYVLLVVLHVSVLWWYLLREFVSSSRYNKVSDHFPFFSWTVRFMKQWLTLWGEIRCLSLIGLKVLKRKGCRSVGWVGIFGNSTGPEKVKNTSWIVRKNTTWIESTAQ